MPCDNLSGTFCRPGMLVKSPPVCERLLPMYSDYPRLMIRIARSPIYNLLISFPIACFTGTLAADIAYWQTAEMTWANFSAWMLAVGLVFGVLAWFAGLIDILAHPLLRRMGRAWLQLLGYAVVLVVAFFNTLIHTRDAWTSVVPTGLALSAIVVILMLFNGWLGTTFIFRRVVEVVE